MGNRQTNLKKNGCTESSKFETVMVVQTHAHDRENGGFFLFFPKRAVIYTKLRFFLEK